MGEKLQKRVRRGRPRKAENWTPSLLLARANEYFGKCDSRVKMTVTKEGLVPEPNPEPYSIEGLCVYLDITRDAFLQWRKKSDELGRRAEKIHQRIMANRVTGALDGTQNSSFAQFMLKNNAPESYREKVEVETDISERSAKMFDEWSKLWEARK